MIKQLFILALLTTLAHSEDYFFGFELDDVQNSTFSDEIYILGLGSFTTNLSSVTCNPAIVFLNGTPSSGSFIYSDGVTAFFEGTTSCTFSNYTCLLYNSSNFTYVYLNTSYANNRSNFSNVNIPMNYFLVCRLYHTDTTYVQTETRQYSIIGESLLEGDLVVLGTIIGLAIFAALFAYLHINSKSYVWSQAWFFFFCLMVLAELMAIVSFANDEGSTTIADVGMALFAGFVWVFILSLWIFLYTMIKELLNSIRDAWRGKKSDGAGKQGI